MADAESLPSQAGRPEGPSPPSGSRSRLAGVVLAWLPAGVQVRRLLVVSFIDSLGTGMFLTGSALFFTRDLGLTAGQVGLGLSLGGVTGLLCSVPIGRFSDRVGPRSALIALQLWRAASFFAYPLVTGLDSFIVVSCMAGAGEWAAAPVVQSLVALCVPHASRVRTMSAMALIRNVGFTLGAGSATAAIALGGGAVYRGLVVIDAVSFLLSGALLLRLRTGAATAGPGTDGGPGLASASTAAGVPREAPGPRVRPGARYLTLAGLNGVLYLHAIILTVGLPLWIATRTRAPVALIGATVVVNTVLAIVAQMPLSRGVDGVRPAASRQLRAGCTLALCCLLVAVTGPTAPTLTVALVLAATAALTVGEIYQSVGAWGVSYGLAPEQRRGYYLSVYSLGSTGAMIVGPWLITSTVLPAGALGWSLLAAAFAVSGALVPVVASVRAPSLRTV